MSYLNSFLKDLDRLILRVEREYKKQYENYAYRVQIELVLQELYRFRQYVKDIENCHEVGIL